MSLLREMPYSSYKYLTENEAWVREIAHMVHLKNIKSGKQLINELDKRGYNLKQFNDILSECNFSASLNNSVPKIESRIQEQTVTLKVAILVANANYVHWADLITPLSDCRALGSILKCMNFIVIIIENVNTNDFKKAVEEICKSVPKKSFILFYFAGHGFELCGTKYMLGVESPSDKYTTDNGISENFILKNGFCNHPELFILLLDMCRTQPDRQANEEIYLNIAPIEEYKDICNLIIGYATSPYMPAYEECCGSEKLTTQTQHDSCKINKSYCESRAECINCNKLTTDINHKTTCKIESKKALSGISLYVSYLSKHLKKNEDFVKILEMVHKDFAQLQCEQAVMQKPQKLDNVAKHFYLSAKVKGDKKSSIVISNAVRALRAENININIIDSETKKI